jgi:hypothetical protein
MSDTAEFESHYRTLPDDELGWIAMNKAATLLPEALQALRSELDRRGLSKSTERGIQAQTRQWSQAELAALVDQYRRGACPRCGVQGTMLNAVIAAVARSFIIVSSYQTKLVIGCSPCLRAEVDRLNRQSLLLGWWGIPWGPIYTIRALHANSQAKNGAEGAAPTPALVGYVASNIGEIASDMASR